MAKFPTMKKSKVDYQAELAKFDWTAARKKAEVPFDSGAVSKAKQLIAEAKDKNLPQAYGKVGVVDGNLVFRIKYGSEQHYGKGDIVLVSDFETVTAQPQLSEKSKNQGVLQLSSEKNPFSRKWWAETLGEQNDPTGFDKLLENFETAKAALDGDHRRAKFDAAEEAMRRVRDGLAALQNHFTAENDQRILARLEAGVKAADVSLHSKKTKYEERVTAARAETLKRLVDDVRNGSVVFAKDMGRKIAEIKRTWEKGEIQQAQKQRDTALVDLDGMLKQFTDDYRTRCLQLMCEKYEVPTEDVILGPYENQVNPSKAPLEQLRQQLEQVLTGEGGTGTDELAGLYQQAEELAKLLEEANKAAEYGLSLAEDYTTHTRYNLNSYQWHAQGEKQLAQWQQQQQKLLGDVAKARQATPSDSVAGKALAKLEKNIAEVLPAKRDTIQARLEQVAGFHARKGQVIAAQLGKARTMVAEVEQELAKAKEATDKALALLKQSPLGGQRAIAPALAAIKAAGTKISKVLETKETVGTSSKNFWPHLTSFSDEPRFQTEKQEADRLRGRLREIEAELVEMGKQLTGKK
jgi:hypothetical protein